MTPKFSSAAPNMINLLPFDLPLPSFSEHGRSSVVSPTLPLVTSGLLARLGLEAVALAWPTKMWARAITGGLGWLWPGLAQAMAYGTIEASI